MKKLMKLMCAVCLLIICGCANTANTAVNKEKIVGEWYNSTNNEYVFMNGDMTYQTWIMSRTSKITRQYVDGNYEVRGDTLKLIPNNGTEVTHDIEVSDSEVVFSNDGTRFTYQRITREELQRGIGEIE